MSKDTIHKTSNQLPKARVYFLDKNWSGAENLSKIKVITPDVEDVLNINTTRGNIGVIGKFTLTIQNNDDKYFVVDDIDQEISNLNEPSKIQAAEDKYQKEPYPYKDAKEFLDNPVVNRNYSPSNDNYTPVGGSNDIYVLQQNDVGLWGYWDVPDSEFNEEGVYTGSDYTSHFRVLNPQPSSSKSNADFFSKYGGDMQRGRCLFEPMQRCVILFSTSIDDPENPYDLMTVFTGLVSTVTDSYSENLRTITVQGEDLTKWLRLTLVNINPAILTEAMPDSGDFFVFEHKFSEMEGWEIIKTLILGDPENPEEKKTQGEKNMQGVGKYHYRVEQDPTKSPTATGIQFKETFAVGAAVVRNGEDTSKSEQVALFRDDILHLQIFQGIETRKDASGTFVTSPYKAYFRQQANAFENNYVKHWDIASEVSKVTNFEFYADANGDIWYHQPRFNNYHILTHKTPEVYIIRDEDIVNADFSEADAEVVTSILVNGQMDVIEGMQPELDQWNFYEDVGLLRKYGRRMFITQHPYVRTKEDCFFFAKSLIYRINADRFTGELTIIGRPEIQPAMPVYISYRNMIYYVKEVQHKFTFGEQFTTTLQLQYGHKPWEILQEVLDYKTVPPQDSEALPLVDYEKIKNHPADKNKLVTEIIPGSFVLEGVLTLAPGGGVVLTAPGTEVFSTISGEISETGNLESTGIPYIKIDGDDNFKDISLVYYGVKGLYKQGRKLSVNTNIGKIYGDVASVGSKTFFYAVTYKGQAVNVNDIHEIKFE